MGTQITHEGTYDVYYDNGRYCARNMTTGHCLHRLNTNVWRGKDGLIRGELVSLLETGVAEERAKQQRQHKAARNTRPAHVHQPVSRPLFNKPREPRGNGRVE